MVYTFVYFRFITLLDSVLPYMVPSWEYSIGSYSSLEVRSLHATFVYAKYLLETKQRSNFVLIVLYIKDGFIVL